MEQNLNQPQVGMSMKNPSLLKEGEFPLAVNGILQSVNGNFAMLSNDHSNILATKFKEGYKVIGTNLVASISTTFFFLVNPETGDSEIGFIYDATNQDKPDPSSNCAGCNYEVVEDVPLEQTVQNPVSTYYTFVNAKCLNFSIDNPVTSWFSVEDCNITMYFNDFKNPPRYIDYTDFQKVDLSNCPLVQTDQLDCDKILVFPEACYPIVEVVDVVSGGQNTAGIYQFAVCYADVNSKKITDYFYVSNPTPLYDQAIIPNANTAYPIAKSFKLQITNLNTDFKYFNLAVLKTINNVTSVFLVETFDIKSNLFEYIYTGIDKNLQADLSIDEIIGKRPYYNKAKITSESNGYLFMANLEEDRVLNLQPVVSKIPLYWQTVEMNDGDYANPIIAQNYVGYLGDEIYAFGIAFTKKNGKQTNVFPFVGREATPADLAPVSDLYINDIIGYSVCNTSLPPSGEWQVYNTANTIGPVVCPNIAPSGQQTVTIVDEIDCESDTILYLTQGNSTIPSFYTYPPSGITYPPSNSQQASALETWLQNQTPLSNVATDQTTQTSIDLCDCDSFLNQYPAGATATYDPINIDIANPNTSSVNIINEQSIFNVNQYNISSSTLAATVPKPAAYAGPAPDPCKRYASEDDDELIGFQAWIDEKENNNFSGAIYLLQSYNQKCSSQTWGSFIGNGGSDTDSWYQVYITNPDGVALITVSTTVGGNCLGNGANNVRVSAYRTDPITGDPDLGNPLASNQTPNSNNGVYVFLTGLTVNQPIFIKVTGGYPDPAVGNLTRNCCKSRSFRICVVSPNPSSTISYSVPGSATISKVCKITYQGVPENNCEPQPHKYGKFAFWQSAETYPCNEEVWGDLAGKFIRHFKFPDNYETPFFIEKGPSINSLSRKSNKIYPKGVRLKIEDVKSALIQAVDLGLITNEERNQICGYRVYRSNRRGNQSIIAKGLLYDVWQYRDNIYDTGNQVLFPNFPFNDNRENRFIKTTKIKNRSNANQNNFLQHPYPSGIGNNKYTFDAPNLSFNNPGLGTELKIEGEQFGKSIGNYIELKNNTKYQYIGPGIITAAFGFASLEAAFETVSVMVNATLTQQFQVLGTGFSVPIGLFQGAIAETLLSPLRIYSHYSEWYEIIKRFAPFRNYAIYYTGVGTYINNYNTERKGNIRRTIANAQYIKPGILNVKTTRGATRFNNFKRESSVFIELDRNTFFLPTENVDTSRVDPQCNTIGANGDVASYYASIKNILVNQYGQIDNINWIDTGYNGRIEWEYTEQTTDCETIFGGDTYINRFTKKRKVPMFLEDRVIPTGAIQVSPVNQDIQLSLLPNIGYPRYFMDYPTSLDYTNGVSNLFGDVATLSKKVANYNFLCFDTSGKSWLDAGVALGITASGAPAAFLVFSLLPVVGITVGVLAGTLGTDVFLKGKYVHSFYGITSFLCESDYNLDYRHGENIKEKNFYPNVGDTNEWTQEFYVPMYEDNYFLYNTDYSKQNTFNPNFVLNNDFSQEDSDCETLHPNRVIYSLQDDFIFLANNFYEFPRSGGKLLILKGIENNKVLAVQENRASIFNSFISLETNVATATVGSNTLFNQQSPTLFIQTDLGFGGSQTPAIVSTEFGHFWVDNKRGQVLSKTEGVSNIVKPEEEWWFKENLPFKILKDFPEFDITNNFKYIGMAITYDARYKRIFFTKRDVELRPEYKGRVEYNGQFFSYKDDKFDITSTKYFCNKSWTLSYNPLFKNFISFHTFTPNYYTSDQAYFSSGVNYSFDDPTEEGLWHHNLTNKSYQVYYGKLNPFIFEFTIASKYANKVLDSVQYISEFYRFQDNLSSYLVPNKTYNKALIYNQNQSTGLLELVPKEKNNRMQFIQYPKQKPESREILVENIENIWRFNNFFNVAQINGQPTMTFDCDNIAYRSINPLAIKYNTQYLKDLMRSDYHVIRLINDKYSNYNILQRFSITDTTPSKS
jgi:hypothetical protein